MVRSGGVKSEARVKGGAGDLEEGSRLEGEGRGDQRDGWGWLTKREDKSGVEGRAEGVGSGERWKRG